MSANRGMMRAVRFCLLEFVWVGSAIAAAGIRPYLFQLYEDMPSLPYAAQWWWVLLPWAVALIVGADYLKGWLAHLPEQGRASWSYRFLVLLAFFYLLMSLLPFNVTIGRMGT